MGIFKNIVGAAAGSLEVKTITSGADVLLSRHASFNIFGINKGLRKHADAIVKPHILNDLDSSFNEATAALLKLAIFYKNFEDQNDNASMAEIAVSVKRLRHAVGNSIRSDISLQVLGETGL